LAGNIGYLDLRMFYPLAMAEETIAAAMRLLAHSHALIVDLRRNDGGDGLTVRRLAGYFFAESVHLVDYYDRAGERIEAVWTEEQVAGPRYADGLLYLLVGPATFSAAESFAYSLKQLGRATLIGACTGGAHRVAGYPVGDHVRLMVPTVRAANPVTGGNWEGTGLDPDVATDNDDALRVAHVMALRTLLAHGDIAPDGPAADLMDEAQSLFAPEEL